MIAEEREKIRLQLKLMAYKAIMLGKDASRDSKKRKRWLEIAKLALSRLPESSADIETLARRMFYELVLVSLAYEKDKLAYRQEAQKLGGQIEQIIKVNPYLLYMRGIDERAEKHHAFEPGWNPGIDWALELNESDSARYDTFLVHEPLEKIASRHGLLETEKLDEQSNPES
jgi:hypothetical protein